MFSHLMGSQLGGFQSEHESEHAPHFQTFDEVPAWRLVRASGVQLDWKIQVTKLVPDGSESSACIRHLG